jgi:starch-binding outer membrane protein, SusD/RagB family
MIVKTKDMKKYFLLYSLFTIVFLSSCQKNWLEKKPNTSLFIPTTLEDCQILLDNNSRLNNREPGIGEIGADNYFKLYADWQTAQEPERNMYIWAPDIYGSQPSPEWRNEYEKIYYANAVLETLEKITPSAATADQYNAVKGSALFFRAAGHYHLVSLFAKQYQEGSAATDLGIPIKTSADINEVLVRPSVKVVYDQILADLTEAKQLLPVNVVAKTRPSKVAAEGLLADVYLTMGNYDLALDNANAAIGKYNQLLNYNTLSTASNTPFTRFNAEVIYHCVQISFGIIVLGNAYVDTTLFRSYQANDLRRDLFYRNRTIGYSFKGSYNQSGSSFFSGIATDELYLIRAECQARKNNLTGAIDDLNTLLRTRWRTGTYVNLTVGTQTQAQVLNLVLLERRKELAFRGRRWNDLRRLNRESSTAFVIKRFLNNQEYTLAPNDNRYVYPIPQEEISRSGIAQNPR